jgi:hypothetical protein
MIEVGEVPVFWRYPVITERDNGPVVRDRTRRLIGETKRARSYSVCIENSRDPTRGSSVIREPLPYPISRVCVMMRPIPEVVEERV